MGRAAAASHELPVQVEMRGRRCVPRERLARALCPLTRRRECGRVVEQLPQRARQGIDVARGHDPAGLEPADDLAQAADVVDDGRDAGTERLQEGTRLVELRAVREDRQGRLRERALELRRAEVPEPPFGAPTGLAAEIVERDPCVTCDEQTGPVDGKRRSNSGIAFSSCSSLMASCSTERALFEPG